MADNETLYTLADIKDFFKYYAGNALIDKTAKKRINKYIEAVESAMRRYDSTRYVPVTRCYECQHWEPENAEEGDYSGHCKRSFGICYGQVTDASWFCADGEREE